MIAKLNNIELWALRALALRRQEHKEKLGIKTKKISGVPEIVITYVGMKGEYVVARLLDLELNTKDMAGGDGGVDLRIKGGKTIDVKTTATQDLIFMSTSHFRSDIAFMVTFDKALKDPYSFKYAKFSYRNMDIVGLISRSRFFRCHEKVDYGYGERVVINKKKLTPVERFLAQYKGKSKKAYKDT